MPRKTTTVTPETETDPTPEFITPRALSREFQLTPQRVRKILRRNAAEFTHDKNEKWRMTHDDAERARALISAYVNARDAADEIRESKL